MNRKPYFAKLIDNKLMLCTYLLKNGDAVKECMEDGIQRTIHHFESVLPYGIFVFNPWPSDKEDYIRADMVWKVVATISPLATHVREGHEFDAEDFKLKGESLHNWLWKGYPNNYRPYERMPDIEKRYSKYLETAPMIAEILGPCGHYH